MKNDEKLDKLKQLTRVVDTGENGFRILLLNKYYTPNTYETREEAQRDIDNLDYSIIWMMIGAALDSAE